ncbi:hypothetical protein B296_00004777 [Ensete ventricosum]|uniref:Uncharacterized protein n=1 Tax=Ensete ventricosum TaxID=4639 RepID=A0A427BBB9_ENSVE|nr:hypothetical protein B296_00004777 [Ensete ventricosum]
MTTTTWVIGGDGKSNDGRGDRGNEQRLRTVATTEEGEVATMIEEHGVAMAAVDSGIVVVAMESMIVGKGNDVTRGGGRYMGILVVEEGVARSGWATTKGTTTVVSGVIEFTWIDSSNEGEVKISLAKVVRGWSTNLLGHSPRIGRLVRYKLAHVLCSVQSRAKACVGSTPCCLRYEFKCSTDRKRGRHFRNTKEGTRSGPMNSATTSAWEFCLWADAGCLIAFLH